MQRSAEMLEQMVLNKTTELEHTLSLRQSLPALESPYVELLQQWENTFSQTIEIIQSVVQEERDIPDLANQDSYSQRIAQLITNCQHQSEHYLAHLQYLEDHSTVFRNGSVDENEASIESYTEQERAQSTVPIGGHTLPPLPYSYNGLEPWIDERTMRIHHDKHHQSYVDGLNNAELKLAEARSTGDFSLVKHWERELAFNGAGHYLHTLFWVTMSPKGGGKPSGELLEEINRSFGSYDAFKKQFTEAANKVEGGGWAIVVWSPRSHRLEILTAEKHQNLSQWDVVPLLPLDVWEHAYYLKHQNDRAGYTKDWWNVVNWPYVAERYAEAQQLQWIPY
ncbi:MAG: superoxide dismutase [Candidatus Cohnella colombiensis]|uniref:superoxide dismutase n=1 Tax=Candidatus Cohnella colombiensis TaxID=3121368 RepID=A0AA95JEW1_9BACL|nr:MAG: superoxide dismutase [Cohnella sp.]